jgi:hypothetical protein
VLLPDSSWQFLITRMPPAFHFFWGNALLALGFLGGATKELRAAAEAHALTARLVARNRPGKGYCRRAKALFNWAASKRRRLAGRGCCSGPNGFFQIRQANWQLLGIIDASRTSIFS